MQQYNTKFLTPKEWNEFDLQPLLEADKLVYGGLWVSLPDKDLLKYLGKDRQGVRELNKAPYLVITNNT